MAKSDAKLAQKSERYNIRAVERALKILSLLSDGKTHSLTDLGKGISVNCSTTYRILSTLFNNKFVEKDSKNTGYKLGLTCIELARAYQVSSDIRKVAIPILEDLRDEIKETVHLAVLDKMEVVYIEKLHGLHAIGIMHSQVGGRAPAYCTGLGKILLAYLDYQIIRDYYLKNGLHRYTDNTITNVDDLLFHLRMVKNKGYALDTGEHELDVRCVAVPIFSMGGKVIAAISVSGPSGRMDNPQTRVELIQQTQEAAKVISSRLGYINEL